MAGAWGATPAQFDAPRAFKSRGAARSERETCKGWLTAAMTDSDGPIIQEFAEGAVEALASQRPDPSLLRLCETSPPCAQTNSSQPARAHVSGNTWGWLSWL